MEPLLRDILNTPDMDRMHTCGLGATCLRSEHDQRHSFAGCLVSWLAPNCAMPSKSAHQKAILAAREMCDGLLGMHRNTPLGQDTTVAKLHFSDWRVCKYTLCGVCPHLQFANSKSDVGQCKYQLCGTDNIKLKGVLEEWGKLSQAEKDRYGYEYDTKQYCENLVRRCDDKIQQSKRRIEAEDRPASLDDLNDTDKKMLIQIAAEMQEKTDAAQKYGEEGNISQAMLVMQELDTLDKQRQNIVKSDTQKGAKFNESKLIVCTVTGQYYSHGDGEERMEKFFNGRQYKGWKLVRETLQRLKARNPPRGTIRPELEPKHHPRDYSNNPGRHHHQQRWPSDKSNYRGDRRGGGGGWDRNGRGRYGQGRDDRHHQGRYDRNREGGYSGTAANRVPLSNPRNFSSQNGRGGYVDRRPHGSGANAHRSRSPPRGRR